MLHFKTEIKEKIFERHFEYWGYIFSFMMIKEENKCYTLKLR